MLSVPKTIPASSFACDSTSADVVILVTEDTVWFGQQEDLQSKVSTVVISRGCYLRIYDRHSTCHQQRLSSKNLVNDVGYRKGYRLLPRRCRVTGCKRP